MTGVYKITNRITNDFYIGQSKNIKKRLYNHRYPGIHSERFESDIQRYGWDNFSFEVIEECPETELIEREAFYIEKLKPTYNTIIRGRKLPENQKKRLRDANLGKKQSAETVQKRKESIAKRKEQNPQTNSGHKKRVLTDYYADGYGSASFDSVKDAAHFFGVHPSTVTKAIKRNGKVRGVRVWLEV